MLAVLRAMGASVGNELDVPQALRRRRQELWSRMVERVSVAWNGRLRVPVRVPAKLADDAARCSIALEDGSTWGAWDWAVRGRAVEVEGVEYVEGSVRLPGRLPDGYHELTFELGARPKSCMIVSAPRAAGPIEGRSWGVFLPLYALRTARSLGVADFSELGDLLQWVAGLGGRTVATLPLLAGFLDEPFDPSPYSPASRLFWNEIFVDLAGAPELQRSEEARDLLAAAPVHGQLRALAELPLVDYRKIMAARRRVVEALARCFFSDNGARGREFESFVRATPGAKDYARFRAMCERTRRPWMDWAATERDGHLPASLAAGASFRYHLYGQWLAAEQLERVARQARHAGASLYFDLPLGVNPSGYDVWRERDAFIRGVSAGAPPDPFFSGGQNWGFPPLSPDGIRQQRYRYPIACIRLLLRLAGVLRIDHVMGVHRLFVIPEGASGDQGVYIRYRPEEMYAIIALESKLAGAAIVGEDLGVVPGYVRQSMARHGLHRSHVLQVEVSTAGGDGDVLPPVPANAVASLNTHDLPTFESFRRDLDPRARDGLVASLRRRGLLGEEAREREVMDACQDYLASSPARMMIVNLEDLWSETEPQNVPGTTDSNEHPNWRRRAKRSFEDFRSDPQVLGTLHRVDELRKQI